MVNDEDTIEQLKMHIQTREGIPQQLFKHIYNRIELNERERVMHERMESYHTVITTDIAGWEYHVPESP